MAKEPKTADSGFMTQEPTYNNYSNTLDALDLISRQAAIDALACLDDYEEQEIETLRKLPSAQRTGRWIWDDEGYHCSECFYHAYGNTSEVMLGDFKFCPNCGARMEERE